jgi:hypothetical protein
LGTFKGHFWTISGGRMWRNEKEKKKEEKEKRKGER